jgi:hypothetical protein
MTNPSDIDQIVQDILADMPLKEKAAIANLDEDKVPYLQYAFDVYLKQLGKDDEMSKDVMHRIWEVLQETHRVRCVNEIIFLPAIAEIKHQMVFLCEKNFADVIPIKPGFENF